MLLPPEFQIFSTELGQVCTFIAGELTLLRRAEITAIGASKSNPLGHAAVGESQPLGHSGVDEALTEAKGYRLKILMRSKPPTGHGRESSKDRRRDRRDVYRLDNETELTQYVMNLAAGKEY